MFRLFLSLNRELEFLYLFFLNALFLDKSSPYPGQDNLSSGQQGKSCGDEEGESFVLSIALSHLKDLNM